MLKNIVGVILLVLLFFVVKSQETEVVDIQKEKLLSALELIRSKYVDSVNVEKIVEEGIEGMLKQLDPHSNYMPKKESTRATEHLVGNFEGVGIQFQILKDTLVVVTPIAGGPSEKVGIMSGDKIVKVDDSLFVGEEINNSKVVKALRGKKGTKVKVSIYRHNNPKLIDFIITRDKIPIFSIDASYMATSKIGYIKINSFSRTTIKEFFEAYTRLKAQNMESLILDLRGNPGGYLQIAYMLADQFLSKNKLIVYTEGLKNEKREYEATRKGLMEKGKVVVLINEGSASASEIVSGALQDWDRGLIVGRRSFGKGYVQQPYKLIDSSEIRLTIARYHTPSGRCIQRSHNHGRKEYAKMRKYRYENGELFHKDSVDLADSLIYYTDGKRVVYGGGGIMPDIFVPMDTSMYSDYYRDLVGKGVVNEFIMEYMDSARTNLEATYTDFNVFNTNYNIDDAYVQHLIDKGIEKEVSFDSAGYAVSKPLIKLQLKALIARNLFTYSEYYQIVNTISPEYKKAIQAIEDNTFKRIGIKY